jgi:hypothetical protein
MVVGEFHTDLFGSRRDNLRMWLSMFPLTYTSFWGNWGWLEVPLPSWALWGLSIATVLSGLSACRPTVVRGIPIVILPALALGLSSLGAQDGKGKLIERITVAGWTVLLLAANVLLIMQARAFYPTS